MKKTLLLLSLAGALVVPAVTHADTPEMKSAKPRKITTENVAAPHAVPSDKRMIFYIMSAPRTGSNIPMVYRRYGGRIDSASNAAVYGQNELRRTGANDVGSELYKLEPSITFRSGR